MLNRLKNEFPFNKYKSDLKLFGKIRNLIMHTPKINNDHVISISEELLNKIKRILDLINNPPKAIDVSTKKSDLYFASIEDSVIDTMKIMKDKLFTHVPILKEGKLIGVFSENTIFTYFSDEEIIMLEEDLKINHFKKYLPLERHINERFEFIPRNAMLYDLENKFKKSFGKAKKLEIIFITENDNKYETILGIVTPWDVLRRKKYV